MIVIAYDSKQKNKIYTLDVTSKNFYSHFDDFFQLSTGRISGFLGVLVFAAIAIINGTPQLHTRLYLNDPSKNFKILMVIIGIVVGILIFFILKINNQKFQLEEYLKEYPDSEKITEKDEINDIMIRAKIRALLIVVVTIGLLIWSIFTYRNFWDYHNFSSYLWATSLFILAFVVASSWKNAQFALRVHSEMYADNG